MGTHVTALSAAIDGRSGLLEGTEDSYETPATCPRIGYLMIVSGYGKFLFDSEGFECAHVIFGF